MIRGSVNQQWLIKELFEITVVTLDWHKKRGNHCQAGVTAENNSLDCREAGGDWNWPVYDVQNDLQNIQCNSITNGAIVRNDHKVVTTRSKNMHKRAWLTQKVTDNTVSTTNTLKRSAMTIQSAKLLLTLNVYRIRHPVVSPDQPLLSCRSECVHSNISCHNTPL